MFQSFYEISLKNEVFCSHTIDGAVCGRRFVPISWAEITPDETETDV